MNNNSRTSNVIKNSKFALLITLGQLLLNLVSRNVFLEALGADVLGLNSTAQSLLSFLNLAELGIGSAIAVTLYKPLYDKDSGTINNIISLQGWFYRRVAGFIIMGSAILMMFFPLIFKDIELPLWYAYASYSAFLFNAVLGYYFNYRQIVLSANQEQYKILLSSNIVTMCFLALQIIVLRLVDNSYGWWLALQFACAIFVALSLHRAVKKSHPYLKRSELSSTELRSRYPHVLTKIKQVFVHKVGEFALYQVQPILIYAYSSLTLVAYYGNYMIIVHGLNVVSNALFNGINASVGNMVASGNKQLINRVFEELFSSRFLMATVMTFSAFLLAPHFITLWIGEEYIMDELTLVLMLVIFFIGITRGAVGIYLYAYGLFKDMWSPITETAINVVASIILGHFFGINGVLSGAILSLLIIVLCWKPYFLFRDGLKESIWIYIKIFVKHHLVLVLWGLVVYHFKDCIYIRAFESEYLNFGLNAITITAANSVVVGIALYAISPGMRDFIKRLIKIVKRG